MQDAFMHLYCGDGKGKTTAAVGLAVRAAGTGKQVLFAQFMKSGKTGEIESLKNLKNIPDIGQHHRICPKRKIWLDCFRRNHLSMPMGTGRQGTAFPFSVIGT